MIQIEAKSLLFVILWLIASCDSKLDVMVVDPALKNRGGVFSSADAYSAVFVPELDLGDDISTVFWEKKSGPGEIFFDDPIAKYPNIYADTPGTYVLTVTVTTAAGIKAISEYVFVWENLPPAAFAIIDMDNEVTTAKPSISWEQARDINSVTYTVTVFHSDCTTLVQQKTGLTSLAYTLENELVNGQTYCLSVIAVDKHAASTKASNDKEVSFTVNTTVPVILSGNLTWANEAADGYIKLGKKHLPVQSQCLLALTRPLHLQISWTSPEHRFVTKINPTRKAASPI